MNLCVGYGGDRECDSDNNWKGRKPFGEIESEVKEEADILFAKGVGKIGCAVAKVEKDYLLLMFDKGG